MQPEGGAIGFHEGEFLLVAGGSVSDGLRAAGVHLREHGHLEIGVDRLGLDGGVAAENPFLQPGLGDVEEPVELLAEVGDGGLPDHAVEAGEDLLKLEGAVGLGLFGFVVLGDIGGDANEAPLAFTEFLDGGFLPDPVHAVWAEDAKFVFVVGGATEDGGFGFGEDAFGVGQAGVVPEAADINGAGEAGYLTFGRLGRNVEFPAEPAVFAVHLGPPEQEIGADEDVPELFVVGEVRGDRSFRDGEVDDEEAGAGEVLQGAADEADALLVVDVAIFVLTFDEPAALPYAIKDERERVPIGGARGEGEVRLEFVEVSVVGRTDRGAVGIGDADEVEGVLAHIRVVTEVLAEIGDTRGAEVCEVLPDCGEVHHQDGRGNLFDLRK